MRCDARVDVLNLALQDVHQFDDYPDAVVKAILQMAGEVVGGLGDTVWEPIEDKIGDWRMTLSLAGKVIADKTFNLINEKTKTEDDFWKYRGY